MPGKFIVFEGLDGSGITTQSTLLRNYFTSKGKDAVLTKEPTDGLIGGIIKSCLRHEWKTNPHTLQLLFTADRAHHATDIEASLKKNKIVICDRYVLSSLAYGSMDVSMPLLKQLNANFRKPHLTIFVDTIPSVCMERIKKARPHIELFEEENRLEQIRKNYNDLKNHFPNTQVVDGNRPPEQILDDVIKIVSNL